MQHKCCCHGCRPPRGPCGQLYAAKTLQLCAPGDPVCFPGGLDRSAHSAYKDNGMAEQAADFAVNALSPASPSRPTDVPV
jgi:cutinase